MYSSHKLKSLTFGIENARDPHRLFITVLAWLLLVSKGDNYSFLYSSLEKPPLIHQLENPMFALGQW